MILETDKAWLAGIVDGEGCITFYKNRTSNPSPCIYIGNTSEDMIIKIKSICDSAEIRYRMDLRIMPKYRNCKNQFIFRVSKNLDVIKFIELIKKYLVVKKAQAELVYECLSVKEKNVKRNDRRKVRVPCANEVWKLNLRGRGYTTPILN